MSDSKSQDAALSNIAPVPSRKTLLLVNTFITNTVDFMNKFSVLCERKLAKIALQTEKLEVTVSLLEAKLESIPWIDQSVPAGSASPSAPAPAAAASIPPPPIASGIPPPPGAAASIPPPPGFGGPALPPPPGAGGLPPPPGAGGLPALPPPPGAGPAPGSSASVPPTAMVQAADASTPLKDDPRYAKYFTMLRVGIPASAIKLKMQAEADGELDPNVLDMDPEGPAPPGSTALVAVDSKSNGDY